MTTKASFPKNSGSSRHYVVLTCLKLIYINIMDINPSMLKLLFACEWDERVIGLNAHSKYTSRIEYELKMALLHWSYSQKLWLAIDWTAKTKHWVWVVDNKLCLPQAQRLPNFLKLRSAWDHRSYHQFSTSFLIVDLVNGQSAKTLRKYNSCVVWK